MMAVGVFGRHGATHDLPQRGVGRSGRKSVMAMGGFYRNTVDPPEWECEAKGFVVWVKCVTYAQCVNLPIASPTDKGPVHK